MLIATFAPVLGALLAWVFLGQVLPPDAIIGILVVILGMVWVVAERGNIRTDTLERDTRRGVVQASLGTLSQATAFVFASQGVTGGFPPISATLIRITAGMVALWIFIAFQRKVKGTVSVVQSDRRLLLLLTAAALSGPVIAGSLLLLSLQYVPVGVSTTLSHVTAIILIPIGYVVFKERITLRAVVGTVVTIIGIGILFS
jgi:drug/metabolite transporter (DMT)-like permease